MLRNAFTLVELLVVITIITILAAMLLPTLENAMDEATKASCMSRLEQQNLCLNMYADDWSDYYPESPASGQRGAWFQEIGKDSAWAGDLWRLHELKYSPTTDLFLCPGIDSTAKGSWASYFPYINTKAIGSWNPYGVSGYVYLADSETRWWYTNYISPYHVFVKRQMRTVYKPWGIDRSWNKLAILSCPMHTLEAFTGGNPFGSVESLYATGQWKWELTGHKKGRPKGMNILTGDGSTRWLGMAPGRFNVGRGSGGLGQFATDAALPYK